MGAKALPQRFGKVIRKRRETAQITQEVLADAAGLHTTYISLLERGKRNPSLVTVEKLAEALATTMTSLMRDVEGDV